MKNQIKQIIGFTFEIIGFVSCGYSLAFQEYTIASLFLALAFFFAIWTGKRIKEENLK